MAACVVFGVAYWRAVLRAGNLVAPVREGASALLRRLRAGGAQQPPTQRKADSPVRA
jgi:hypothetical protein